MPLNIFYAVFANIIYLLAGSLSGSIIAFIVGYSSWDYMFESWILFVSYFIIAFILAFFISFKAGEILHQKLHRFDAVIKNKFAIYMTGGATITLVHFFINTFLRDTPEDVVILGVVYVLSPIIYFAFIAFAIFTFTDKYQIEIDIKHQKELLSNLQTYTTELNDSANKVKEFVHDHKNILFGFYEHLESNDIVGAREYYKSCMVTIDKIIADDSPLNMLSKLEIPELRSILLLKLLHAQQQNIDVHIEMVQVVKNIKLPDLVDICRIFGILLDNTIEACQDTEQAVIKFMSLKVGDSLIFAFANTCHEPPPLDKVFERGFSTKGEGRGYGLSTISKLTGKNENIFISTHIKDGYFTQKLTIAID